jgi:Lysine-specific metallo-endopeptidase
MYIRSHDGLDQIELPSTHGMPGLSDGMEKKAGISPEVIFKLADLVFFARHPDLVGKNIKGTRSLELEYSKIRDQLLNPSSTSLPNGFEIDLTLPANPQPDYGLTEKELGVWEAAIFKGNLLKFSVDKTLMPDGSPGSYVSMLSARFDKPLLAVMIAKELRDNSHDPTAEPAVRNAWRRVLTLVQAHAYAHLDIYRRVAKDMEKVLQELFSRLLPLPTTKKPLAVSSDRLHDYMVSLGVFLTEIAKFEFRKKTCAWERQDYPILTQKIMDRKQPTRVHLQLELPKQCLSKPKLPDIPLPPIPLNAVSGSIQTRGLRGKAIAPQKRPETRGSLGEAAGAANKFNQCWEPQKNVIQAAFLNARTQVNRAAAVLGNAYGRPDKMAQRTRDLLNRHFHTTDRDNILEIFRTIFRIQQAIDKGLNFRCEINCGKRVRCGYANATQWFGGRGPIHICFDNRPGFCSFVNLSAQEQAAAIIHEAAHRHVGIDDKAYVWEKPPLSLRDYSKLTSKQAMDNADSYAWFCVEL